MFPKETIQENLRFCRGNVAEHNGSASVYVDYLSLITGVDCRKQKIILWISYGIIINYLFAWTVRTCLSRLFQQRNYHKRIFGEMAGGCNAFWSSVSLNGKK